MSKYPSLPHPNGWFALCFSAELRPGELEARTLFGREVIVFRTESGRAAMLDAHCPHLGAHLGEGGRVEGETIRCPFHGFRFDTEGACTATPYATKIPPKCSTRSWELREQNGVVLVWYHHRDEPPSFEVPVYDLGGWMPLMTHVWTVSTHPQETSENSVDLGHFIEVHKYFDLEVLDELRVDGPYLSMQYAMSRAGFGLSRGAVSEVSFRAHVHGLGFSHVVVHEKRRNIDLRYWVMCTPTHDDMCELRVACTTKLHPSPRHANFALGLIPPRAANYLIQRFAFSEFLGDIAQDFDIWRTKTYVDQPALAKGDGPIGQYRRWCRQFYPQLPVVQIAAS